jgi:hypothetical protein
MSFFGNQKSINIIPEIKKTLEKHFKLEFDITCSIKLIDKIYRSGDYDNFINDILKHVDTINVSCSVKSIGNSFIGNEFYDAVENIDDIGYEIKNPCSFEIIEEGIEIRASVYKENDWDPSGVCVSFDHKLNVTQAWSGG